MAIGMPVPVEQPPVSRVPHDLISTAEEASDPAGTQWWRGFKFIPRYCGTGAQIWAPCTDLLPENAQWQDRFGSGSGDVEQEKTGGDGDTDEVVFFPYAVWDIFTCGTRGMNPTEYKDIALRSLELTQGRQIEYELWTGAVMFNTEAENVSFVHSTPADGVLNPGGAAAPEPVSPRVAMSLGQQASADCGPGGRGMMHVVPYLGEMLANADMISEVGGKLMMKTRGTLVVNGQGYTGEGPAVVDSDPAATDSDLVWVYFSGMVEYRLTDELDLIPTQRGNPVDSLAQAFDRSTNTVEMIVERQAAAVFNPCCLFAVLVDLSLGTC